MQLEPPLLAARIVPGFWRRVLALVVDGIVLGVAGNCLGLAFFDYFAHLGPWGRLVGFGIALAYFGVLNSSLGRGQTLGKRLMKIEVVDRSGAHLSPAKSALRYVILGVPFFLNRAALPATAQTPLTGFLLTLFVFGIGGAIAYLYVFNRRTRQSLHDLAVGSFVVQSSQADKAVTAEIWRPHLAIVSLWLVLIVGLFSASRQLLKRPMFAGLLATQKSLLKSGQFSNATVTAGQNWSMIDGKTRRTSHVQSAVSLKERPGDFKAAAGEVAGIVLDHYPAAVEKDMISVIVSYGYDIGIAHASVSQSFEDRPQNWLKFLGRKSI